MGTSHQIHDLVDLIGHALSDPAPGFTVHQDEEGRTGNLVVPPRLGGHDNGHPVGGLGGNLGRDFHFRAFGDHHQPQTFGEPQTFRLPQITPEPGAGDTARREEGEQGEPISAGHGKSQSVPGRRDPGNGRCRRRIPLGRESRTHGHRRFRDSGRERNRRGALIEVVTGIRIAHANAQIVECLEDVGMAAQQPGHQHGQQHHHDAQDNCQGNHTSPPLHRADGAERRTSQVSYSTHGGSC